MTTIKTEGFELPGHMRLPRPDFRRPFSDGSMAVDTNDLAASLNTMPMSPFDAYSFEQPLFGFDPSPVEDRSRSLSSTRVGKAPPSHGRSARKLSMTDTRPARTQGPRTMSFSYAEGHGLGGLGISLDTHFERPDVMSFGLPIPGRDAWDPAALPGQSFGTTVDDAIDSPMTPAQPLPPLADADEQTKKQRRRECHNQVEKRRREHINAKIEELGRLLPPQYNQVDEAVEDEEDDEHDSPMKKKKSRRSGSTAKNKDTIQCKGRILTQSVVYIHDLCRTNEYQTSRIQQLESFLVASGFNLQPAIPPPPVFWDPSQLEMMRPSPEPEQLVEPFQPWTEIAPSLAPGDYRRSISSDSSGALAQSASDVSPAESSRGEESRGRQRDRPVRKNTDMELQMSMSGMDLDTMFTRREEDNGGMRW